MIILKENEWAKQMIETHSLGQKPSETLRRIARYYLDTGLSKEEVRLELNTFLKICDSSVSLPKWSEAVDNAIKWATKYKAVNIDHIDITDKEMSKINSVDGTQAKRLAFTLLCLAKYWHIINPNSNYWVNNKDSEIMKLANISTSLRRQGFLYNCLYNLDMIQFSRRVDNTNVRVCFAEEGDTVLSIDDFRNLGFQYLMFCGEPFFKCENCGKITKIRNPEIGRKQKYCKACFNEIKVKQNIESVYK